MTTDASDDEPLLPSPPSEAASEADVFAYIAQMSAELRRLADTSRRGKTIAYLLDVARLAAEHEAKKGRH